MKVVRTVGDRSRDGLLEIMGINVSPNGALSVTIRDLVGHDCWQDDVLLSHMHFLARTVITQRCSSRVVRRFKAKECDYVTFLILRYAKV